MNNKCDSDPPLNEAYLAAHVFWCDCLSALVLGKVCRVLRLRTAATTEGSAAANTSEMDRVIPHITQIVSRLEVEHELA